MARKVWVVNDGGYSYEKAESYGELHSITEGKINPFDIEALTKRLAKRIELAHVDDYVLISGTPMLNALAVVLWLLRFDKANVLQWDAKKSVYKLTPLELGDLGEALRGRG